MIKLLDSRYQIPSRRTLSRTIIPNMFNNVKNKVQVLLNETNYIAITTDIWTSMNTDSFNTITVHFLPNGQTELKTVVLCTTKLEENHTGAYLAEIMTTELNNWGILKKVIVIVTDGGANIKSAVRLMNIQHIPCIAHKLNLIVQQSLYLSENNEVENEQSNSLKIKYILQKCRTIVAFFKRSEVGNRMLVDKQKQLNMEVLKLKQDIRTRWNSTLFMFERLVKLKEPLTIVMISLNEAPASLIHEEWEILEDIIPLLKPFNSITLELSAEQYPTISKVIPLVRGLQISLGAKSPVTLLGQFVKSNLLTNTSRRFESLEKQTLIPYFSRATLLDPRFKKAAFANENNVSEAETSIISEMSNLINIPSNNTEHEISVECNETTENLWTFLQTNVNNMQSHTTSTSSAISIVRPQII